MHCHVQLAFFSTDSSSLFIRTCIAASSFDVDALLDSKPATLLLESMTPLIRMPQVLYCRAID